MVDSTTPEEEQAEMEMTEESPLMSMQDLEDAIFDKTLQKLYMNPVNPDLRLNYINTILKYHELIMLNLRLEEINSSAQESNQILFRLYEVLTSVEDEKES